MLLVAESSMAFCVSGSSSEGVFVKVTGWRPTFAAVNVSMAELVALPRAISPVTKVTLILGFFSLCPMMKLYA